MVITPNILKNKEVEVKSIVVGKEGLGRVRRQLKDIRLVLFEKEIVQIKYIVKDTGLVEESKDPISGST